jgi:hypothetical protein
MDREFVTTWWNENTRADVARERATTPDGRYSSVVATIITLE